MSKTIRVDRDVYEALQRLPGRTASEALRPFLNLPGNDFAYLAWYRLTWGDLAPKANQRARPPRTWLVEAWRKGNPIQPFKL